MKVYFDNVIVCATIRQDLDPQEMVALTLLLSPPYVGKLEVLTSRESWREQERTTDHQIRERFQKERSNINVVSNDHKVLDFSTQADQYRGFIASPIVTDVIDQAVFCKLLGLRLKDEDARHLMYALCNECDRFVTTDPHFINISNILETTYPTIRIVKPSDLLQKLAALP